MTNSKAWLGKKLPEEMKGKIAAGRTKFAGGNTLESIKKELDLLVIKRDLYCCKICGKYGLQETTLFVIQINNKLSKFNLENLITVCKDCKGGTYNKSLNLSK